LSSLETYREKKIKRDEFRGVFRISKFLDEQPNKRIIMLDW
jgi:hypothetical protein